jgi:tetratricopeptide (TPR) repeat protein
MTRKRFRLLVFLFVLLGVTSSSIYAAGDSSVKMWEQDIVIPTYLAGDPEPNPMFYFGRASQGAEGRIYPYPLYDKLTGVKKDKTYRMVYLENEYVRIGILPEIGGRIFEGVDKTNGYNFFYRQHVIKPALIGLIGAWISGGVEWNIPHHHRATTFIPVQHQLEENKDGSKTVWVGELEVRHRMRWAVGYTLRPGKSYLEVSLRILNRTPVANSLLCFANVAVHANENYQVIFPPSTQHVTFHSKRQFTTWPIATGRYAGADFHDGVDVSWYKNHMSSCSMFAWNYEDNFFAGYDHGKKAGTMSVADHHIVPGKKLWTWGNGPNGRMWDKILTDDDGPYIELMVGAYSDNQPDYSWMQPYEVKSFKEYWYPFRDIGGVKKANLDAAVNLEVRGEGVSPSYKKQGQDRLATGQTAKVGFYTTSVYEAATVVLKAADKVLLREVIAIDPGKPYLKQIPIPPGTDEHNLRASISADGKELVAYSPIKLEHEDMPKPVEAPPSPQDIKTNEELYLTGLRIEQFHNPALDPDPYWLEALRRDPGDVRVNTALGINYLKKAKFEEAEKLFRKALERLTAKYTSPKNGEPFYYLGVALKAQGKNKEAFDSFYKATWSDAWKAAGYYSLAEMACMKGDMVAALDFVGRSLEANALNIRALNLKAAVLRHMGQSDDALKALALAHNIADPLDVRIMAERWLATKSPEVAKAMVSVMNEFPATAQETAAEYFNAGLWQDGTEVLSQLIKSTWRDRPGLASHRYPAGGKVQGQVPRTSGEDALATENKGKMPSPRLQGQDALATQSNISPMVYYYLGYFARKMGQAQKAGEYYSLAVEMSPDYVFPFQHEAIAILREAMKAKPDDAMAPYYLGNLMFDWQPEEAVKLWEKSVALGATFPIVYRNLAIAYSHQAEGIALDKAIANLEKAVSFENKYAVHFFELDQLYEAAGTSPEKRLAILEKNHKTVNRRDDALSREISLKVCMGKYDDAIELLQGRKFNIWEGGSRFNVNDCWTDAHLLRGHREFAAGRYKEALADYQASVEFPENLRATSGRGSGRSAEVDYWIATAYEALGDRDNAEKFWTESSLSSPRRSRRGRNIQRYYQALSLQKLGKKENVEGIFQNLVESGKEALGRTSSQIDFFAKFGEQQSQRSRLANAHYMAGLGYLGLKEKDKARREFNQALEASPDHLGAKTMLAQI